MNFIFIDLFLAWGVTLFFPGYLLSAYLFPSSSVNLTPALRWCCKILISLILAFQISFIANWSGFISLYWIYYFVVIVLFMWRLIKTDLSQTISGTKNFFSAITQGFLQKLFLVILVYWIFRNLPRFSSVFVAWDAVFSWNRWAIDWANGIMPRLTWHYPQIIPTAWALVYRYTHSMLHFFVIPIIPILVFSFLISTIETLSNRKWFGVGFFCLAYYFLRHVYGDVVFDGYVDVVVVSTAALALLTFEKARTTPQPDQKILFLSIIAAIACALTKQAGLQILVFLLIEGVLHLNDHPESRSKKKTFLLVSLTLIGVLALPYYLYSHFQILSGNNASEVATITDGLHGGRNYLERFLWSLKLLGPFVSVIFLLNLFWAIYFSGFKRRVAIASMICFLIWAFFVSYDTRNLSVGFALTAFGYGLYLEDERIQSKIMRALQWLPKPSQVPGLFIFAVILIVLFFVGKRHPRSELEARLDRMKIAHYAPPEVSEFLYRELAPRCSRIFTNWEHLKYLPNFEQRADEDESHFAQALSIDNAECVIRTLPLHESFSKIINEGLKMGRIKLVFEWEEYKFYRKRD